MANEVLWDIANLFIRISALLLIKKIFLFLWYVRYLVNIVIIFATLHSLAVLTVALLICRPMAAAWDTSINGTCGQQVLSYVILEIVGGLIDIVILMIPPPIVWKLLLRWPRRLGISIVLSTGVLCVVNLSKSMSLYLL